MGEEGEKWAESLENGRVLVQDASRGPGKVDSGSRRVKSRENARKNTKKVKKMG